MATEHVELITAQTWMMGGFAAATAAGAVLLWIGAAVGVWWVKALLFLVGGFVGLIGLGSLIFGLWGRYAGLPWHFTPAPEDLPD